MHRKTAYRDCSGYRRRLPARVYAWRVLLAPAWTAKRSARAWRRHPRLRWAVAGAVAGLAVASAVFFSPTHPVRCYPEAGGRIHMTCR